MENNHKSTFVSLSGSKMKANAMFQPKKHLLSLSLFIPLSLSLSLYLSLPFSPFLGECKTKISLQDKKKGNGTYERKKKVDGVFFVQR